MIKRIPAQVNRMLMRKLAGVYRNQDKNASKPMKKPSSHRQCLFSKRNDEGPGKKNLLIKKRVAFDRIEHCKQELKQTAGKVARKKFDEQTKNNSIKLNVG